MTILQQLYSDDHTVRALAMQEIANAANSALAGFSGVHGALFVWAESTDPLDDERVPAVGVWCHWWRLACFGPVERSVLRVVQPMGITRVEANLWR